MKAIETVYKGYRFRSRLEARWAVFFDALSVRWEYEKEGFVIPNRGPYLPDFWLPELQCWVEIKPTFPTDEEAGKVSGLAWESGFAAALAYGMPLENYLSVYCQDGTDSSGGEGWWGPLGSGEDVTWAWSDSGLCIDSDNSRSDRNFSGFYFETDDGEEDDCLNPFPGMRLTTECDRLHPRIKQAALAARSAQFEFGKHGATL